MMIKITAALLGIAMVAGCSPEGFEGTRRYHGPESVIATGKDKGRDASALVNGVAAIAYDPDGCQNWMIDDGLEGYSSPRYDPVSGLPVCNNHYPPGTVIGTSTTGYTSGHPGLRDRVSGPGRKTVVVQRQR